MLNRDVLVGAIMPYCDFTTRATAMCCDRTAQRDIPRGAGYGWARRLLADERLAHAGAPAALLRLVDFGAALARARRADEQDTGSTGYIDFLTPAHFAAGRPILYGTDICGRFYLALKYEVQGRLGISCLFQRYNNNDELFVNAPDLWSGVCASSVRAAASLGDLCEHHSNLLRLAEHGAVAFREGHVARLAA